MIETPTTYTVWYRAENFGVVDEQVTAIDILEAIQKIIAKFQARYGEDKKVYILRVL